MQEIKDKIKETMAMIKDNLDKGTKASEARVRKLTLLLEKQGKEYRKLSVASRK